VDLIFAAEGGLMAVDEGPRLELGLGHCTPRKPGTPPLPDDKEREYLAQVASWDMLRNGVHRLTRAFKFRDFRGAMEFVNGVAELAEAEGHHPDIRISWNKVRLELTTHSVGGLSENDFIMAARIDDLFNARPGHADAP
jgi:4a-hydroxytetrahydrobiopterin dehydratase